MIDPWLDVIRAIAPLPSEERIRCLRAALTWAEAARRQERTEEAIAVEIVEETIAAMKRGELPRSRQTNGGPAVKEE